MNLSPVGKGIKARFSSFLVIVILGVFSTQTLYAEEVVEKAQTGYL